MARRTRAQTAMNLSPEIIDAIGSQYKAMGFEFDPRGLARIKAGGPDVVGLASAMGLPPKADIPHCHLDVRFVPIADIALLTR
jgi:hypothetical protein